MSPIPGPVRQATRPGERPSLRHAGNHRRSARPSRTGKHALPKALSTCGSPMGCGRLPIPTSSPMNVTAWNQPWSWPGGGSLPTRLLRGGTRNANNTGRRRPSRRSIRSIFPPMKGSSPAQANLRPWTCRATGSSASGHSFGKTNGAQERQEFDSLHRKLRGEIQKGRAQGAEPFENDAVQEMFRRIRSLVHSDVLDPDRRNIFARIEAGHKTWSQAQELRQSRERRRDKSQSRGGGISM